MTRGGILATRPCSTKQSSLSGLCKSFRTGHHGFEAPMQAYGRLAWSVPTHEHHRVHHSGGPPLDTEGSAANSVASPAKENSVQPANSNNIEAHRVFGLCFGSCHAPCARECPMQIF
mmetsp:Transcript_42183/g.111509  ORF Transcript_42183/g.111509 Transcript_42183/m.111509 type:complete len:117 (-) Transcript_42183:33-383(-)